MPEAEPTDQTSIAAGIGEKRLDGERQREAEPGSDNPAESSTASSTR